jgi:hypothetical protein
MNQTRDLTITLACLGFACVPFFDTTPTGEVGDAGADGLVGGGVCCTRTACLVINEEQCAANDGIFQSGLDCAEAACLPPTCDDYCGTWAEVCSERFPDEFGVETGECRSFCEAMAWEPGRFNAVSHPETNSIGCRIYHMAAALGSDDNQDLHCPHAGATGGNVCGDLCNNYCHIANTICADISFDAFLDQPAAAELDRARFQATFAGQDMCSTWCRGEGRSDPLPTDGQIGDPEGDSIQCRLYHLVIATNAQTIRGRLDHCSHASLTSVPGVCDGPLPNPTD